MVDEYTYEYWTELDEATEWLHTRNARRAERRKATFRHKQRQLKMWQSFGVEGVPSYKLENKFSHEPYNTLDRERSRARNRKREEAILFAHDYIADFHEEAAKAKAKLEAEKEEAMRLAHAIKVQKQFMELLEKPLVDVIESAPEWAITHLLGVAMAIAEENVK